MHHVNRLATVVLLWEWVLLWGCGMTWIYLSVSGSRGTTSGLRGTPSGECWTEACVQGQFAQRQQQLSATATTEQRV